MNHKYNEIEEEEEEDCFYESLDHSRSSASLLSSSSDEEEEVSISGSPIDDQDQDQLQIPKFPMSAVVSAYEVWVSEPESVEERRRRLLREMGLSSDPLLSRIKNHSNNNHICSNSNSDYNRSNSALLEVDRSAKSSDCIVRSKSDGAVDCEVANSTNLVDCVESGESGSGSGNCHLRSKSRGNGGLVSSLGSSPSKPPTGRGHRRGEEGRCDSAELNPNPSSNGEFAECGDGSDQVCTIKNLDNGEEFVVVNEIREDGMWDKVREVGTGRQLTMEEFESCVGHSPIVQELMRRQNVEQLNGKHDEMDLNGDGGNGGGIKSKKKSGWFKSIKHVANSVTGHRERRSSDERDTSSEKGGRRSSSATDDSQDGSFHGPERVRVRQYGKSHKDLTALYKCQEIQAHAGSIWTIKFSLDGRYLASAGEDTVIHVWQVVESERKGDLLMEKPEDGNPNLYFALNGSPESALVLSNIDSHLEKKRRGRPSISRKSVSLEHIVVPETVFALSEKPICSFQGHLDDVLDLSWSKSQYLLSSSMDKTVRLWHMGDSSCLKVFSHSDYVTCIQFNPVDDSYFISGSLDAKVRIWSIPDRQVVDWNDLHEMVTAACYTPDGQGALVGTYKGNCYLYNTSENKLHQKSHVNLQNKKKKSHLKKITGFQFSPGSSSEVLVTSADSRIRVIDSLELVHKFKGFRNTSSQISASMASNGKYVVCASGDSYVYVWNHEGDSRPNRSKAVTVTSSYEHFHCQDVSVALPWPGIGGTEGMIDTYNGEFNGFGTLQDEVPGVQNSPLVVEEANGHESSPSVNGATSSPMNGILSKANSTYFFDRISATWPEEKLLQATRNRRSQSSLDFSNEVKQGRSAWGIVIVTAGLRGEIKTFQNYGLPVRL